MKKRVIYFLILQIAVFQLFACSEKEVESEKEAENEVGRGALDKKEARAAVEYLNKVRGNPSAYSEEIGCDLSYVASRHPLVWNEKLAAVAERKALDMANRNYFSHIDPDGYGMNYYINKAGYTLTAAFLKDKTTTNFESIGAGYQTGIKVIQGLILDKNYPKGDEGHRIHLLGIHAFWSNCYDIGIGFVHSKNSTYSTYCCILIAKHDF